MNVDVIVAVMTVRKPMPVSITSEATSRPSASVGTTSDVDGSRALQQTMLRLLNEQLVAKRLTPSAGERPGYRPPGRRSLRARRRRQDPRLSYPAPEALDGRWGSIQRVRERDGPAAGRP